MNENAGKVVKTVKTAIGLVGGIGVATIIGNAVKHVSPTDGAGFIMKLCVLAGGTLLGGLACEATESYANRQIDEICEALQSSDGETKEDESEESE